MCKGSTDGGSCTKDALIEMSEKCNNESECTIYGNLNGVLGDPCRRNHKYLSYEYECDYSRPNLVTSFCEMDLEDRNGIHKICRVHERKVNVLLSRWRLTLVYHWHIRI